MDQYIAENRTAYEREVDRSDSHIDERHWAFAKVVPKLSKVILMARGGMKTPWARVFRFWNSFFKDVKQCLHMRRVSKYLKRCGVSVVPYCSVLGWNMSVGKNLRWETYLQRGLHIQQSASHGRFSTTGCALGLMTMRG